MQAPGCGLIQSRLRFQTAGQVWKLPEPRQQTAAFPLSQGQRAVAGEDEDRALFHAPGFFFCADGIALPASGLPGRTERGGRAGSALRLAVWQADRGAQLHQGLGQRSGPGLRITRREAFAERPLDRGLVHAAPVRCEPGQHAQHVAVHGRGRQIETDRADRPGGVVSDPGQGPDGCIVMREDAVELRRHSLRGFLQVSHPGIVAQPLPELVQQLGIRRGQRRQLRHGGQKAGIVALDGLHAGLLEHDLREPDVIGLPVLPPGQVPGVCGEPVRQNLYQLSNSLLPVHYDLLPWGHGRQSACPARFPSPVSCCLVLPLPNIVIHKKKSVNFQK